MKNIILFISMLTMAMGFVSCSNDDDLVEQSEQTLPQNEMMTFFAKRETCTDIESNAKITRTQLKDDGSVVWSKTDNIYIGTESYSINESGAFQGKILEGNKSYTAYYYGETGTALQIPATQNYNSKIISYVPMSATISVKNSQVTNEVLFKNSCGLVLLKIKSSSANNIRRIRYIKISADEPMAGNIDLINKDYYAVINSKGEKSIILDCGENGVALTAEGTDFYITMPVVYTKNLIGIYSYGAYSNVQIKITDVNNNSITKKFKSGKTLRIERSKITPVTFTESFATAAQGEYNDHEWVDLGLKSGLKWAKKNVGANDETDDGEYFAWGEINKKDGYSWGNYSWCNNDMATPKFTKYCNVSTSGVNGYTDTCTQLVTTDDVATQKWGDKWRMPTEADMIELLNNCYWEKTAKTAPKQGWYVYKARKENDELVKANDNDRIFLPNAQYKGIDGKKSGQSYGYYWTSALNTDDCKKAHFYYFGASSVEFKNDVMDRYFGLTVRPVLKQ